MAECFILEPTSEHTHTIIFLHGRGSSGQEFAEELFECEVEDPNYGGKTCTFNEALPGLKWIFPSAPTRFSATFQESMSQWFDINSLSNPNDQQATQFEGLTSSIRTIRELINVELVTVPPERLFIGGMSQGAAIGMIAMIVLNLDIGGFIGLSSWLPCSNVFDEELSQGYDTTMAKIRSLLNLDEKSVVTRKACWISTPIFLGHEKHDPVVLIEHGRRACNLLQQLRAAPEWSEYESGDHWIQEPDEARDILRFLQKQMTR